MNLEIEALSDCEEGMRVWCYPPQGDGQYAGQLGKSAAGNWRVNMKGVFASGVAGLLAEGWSFVRMSNHASQAARRALDRSQA